MCAVLPFYPALYSIHIFFRIFPDFLYFCFVDCLGMLLFPTAVGVFYSLKKQVTDWYAEEESRLCGGSGRRSHEPD